MRKTFVLYKSTRGDRIQFSAPEERSCYITGRVIEASPLYMLLLLYCLINEFRRKIHERYLQPFSNIQQF